MPRGLLAQMLMANRAAAVVVRIELTRTTERRIRSFISLPAFYRNFIQHQYTITSPSGTGYFFRVFRFLRKNLRFQTAHSQFDTIGSFFVFPAFFCDITGSTETEERRLRRAGRNMVRSGRVYGTLYNGIGKPSSGTISDYPVFKRSAGKNSCREPSD